MDNDLKEALRKSDLVIRELTEENDRLRKENALFRVGIADLRLELADAKDDRDRYARIAQDQLLDGCGDIDD